MGPLSSSAADCGCDGRNRKTPRNTSTYVVRTAPLPFLEGVEKRSPIGHTHAHRRSLKKTQNDPKKTRQRRSLEEDGVRRKCRFTPAESLHIQLGGHTNKMWCNSRSFEYSVRLVCPAKSFFNFSSRLNRMRCGNSSASSSLILACDSVWVI